MVQGPEGSRRFAYGSVVIMFPLPIAPADRTSPLDFIPDCDDPQGHGARMWEVMSMLKITQGPLAGQDLGVVAPPWQEKWIRTLYGNTDEVGNRIWDEALLLISKKQGKSTLSGMLAIAHTLAFPEQRGSGIILADTKEQAGLVYDSMASTVEADPYLLEEFHVRRYRSDIIHRPTKTALKAVAAELAATVGQIPSFYIVDELHLLGLKPKGGMLVRQLSSGLAVRGNGLGIYITTAPVGMASGIYTSTYNRGHRILEGKDTGERMFPVMFEIPEELDVEDPDNWWMCNPSLGYTFKKDWLLREFKIAKNDPDPSTFANFLSQHLNVHAQERMGIDRWIPTDDWDVFADDSVTLSHIIEEAHSIFCGVDAGYRGDPSSIVVLGIMGDDEMVVWNRQWLHHKAFNEYKDKVPYEEFEDHGDLIVGQTENADIAGITAIIGRAQRSGKLVCVGVDPAKLKTMVTSLEGDGIEVVAVPQGWKMNPHLIETERLLYSGKLLHSGSPMLRWNIANGRLAERGQAKALVKPSDLEGGSGTQKIDGLVCLVMAVAVATDPNYKMGMAGSGNLVLI